MHWLAVGFRAWIFGVALGVVLGGGLGTFGLPGLGTVLGAVYGAAVGAMAGLAQGLLVVLGSSFDVSPLADRIWSGTVSGAIGFVVTMEMSGIGVILTSAGYMLDNPHVVLVAVLTACSAAAGAAAGRFMTCGAPVDGLRRPRRAFAAGAVVGAVLPAVRLLPETVEGRVDLSEIALLVVVGAVSGCALAAVALLLRVAETA